MVRDFTGSKLYEFTDYMNSYFSSGEDNNGTWWNRFLYSRGFYDIEGTAGGDAKKYVRSLGKVREEAEAKINRVWVAVAEVEESYSARFAGASEQLAAYLDMVKQLQGCIGSGQLGGSYDFEAFMSRMRADYLTTLEARARRIIEQDPSQWTDGDLEILAYVSVSSKDETFPLDVANAFYTKTGKYPGSNYDAYQRDGEQWDKYVELSSYFYAESYREYLYGDPPMSDSEIERILRNRNLIQQFDNVPSDVYLGAEDGQLPFTLETRTGRIDYWYTKDPPAKEFSDLQQSTIPRTDRSDRVFQQLPHGAIRRSFDPSVHFDTAAEISTTSHMEDANLITEQYDWFGLGIKAAKDFSGKSLDNTIKYAKKAAENAQQAAEDAQKIVDTISDDLLGAYMPGYSKLVFSGVDIVTDIIADGAVPDLTAYREGFDLEYAEKFRMKLMTTGDGYMVLPTPETRQCVDRVMNWLQQNRDTYPALHASYYPPDVPLNGLGAPGDPLNFYTSLNMTAFLQDIRTAGVTNELF